MDYVECHAKASKKITNNSFKKVQKSRRGRAWHGQSYLKKNIMVANLFDVISFKRAMNLQIFPSEKSFVHFSYAISFIYHQWLCFLVCIPMIRVYFYERKGISKPDLPNIMYKGIAFTKYSTNVFQIFNLEPFYRATYPKKNREHQGFYRLVCVLKIYAKKM